MSWLQLCLDARQDELETLENLMLATGSVAVTMEDNADQPVLEPGVGETPLWIQTRLTGLYPATTDMEAVLAQFPDELLVHANHRVEILEDKDWEREWMKHYRPMQFGKSFWICPSWIEPPDPEATNLLLDPGLAFGTGTHPTTSLCLQQLEAMELTGHTVVDYGCGSGILAVAALKLGAGRVLGVDNDQLPGLVRVGMQIPELKFSVAEMVDQQMRTNKILDRFYTFDPKGKIHKFNGDKISYS